LGVDIVQGEIRRSVGAIDLRAPLRHRVSDIDSAGELRDERPHHDYDHHHDGPDYRPWGGVRRLT
jgi:hypothetical protein